MKKNNLKKYTVLAAAGIMSAGLSVCAFAAPQGGAQMGGFGGGAPMGGFGGGNFSVEAQMNNGSAPSFQISGNDQKTETPPAAPLDENGNPMAPLDGTKAQDGTQDSTNTQTPPAAPLDENGNPMAPLDGTKAQDGSQNQNGNQFFPQNMMNGQKPDMAGGIDKILSEIEDEDEKSALQALVTTLQEAMEAEKNAMESESTDQDTLTTLREAVEAARKALDEAVKSYITPATETTTTEADET